MTVILSNADMILHHPGEEHRRWAENIKAESQQMKKLTEDLLSLARAEDTQRRQVLERVDLSYLATDSVLSFEPAAFETGRSLSYQVTEGIFTLGDPAGLSQVFEILLDNAIRYSSAGGKIFLSLEAAGKWARLSVSNTGQEIPQEEIPHIFERFYRGDPARQEAGSHGLGLSIARSVVQAHKGKIWAESHRGKTDFFVLLPCIKP